ncbi:hypothetical protein BJ742DRAFT_873393 [Cladochytrium replicatum]|nr:hypothetical protein BJ742DRAFT_873393 [Cladochytrium replicatum]
MVFVAAILYLAAIATAHVTIQPNVAIPGSYSVLNARVPHGCAGSPTVSVSVKIPANVFSVKPKNVPNWIVEIGLRPRDPPIVSEGVTVNTTIDTITWSTNTSTAILDSFFEDFPFQAQLPKPDADGSKIYFQINQTCVEGFTYWGELPPNASAHPAPALTLRANGTALNAQSTPANSTSAAGRAVTVQGPVASLFLAVSVAVLAFATVA